MPLDTSIPMSYRPNVALDIEGIRKNAMDAQVAERQNKLADMQMQQAQRAYANENAMNEAYRSAVGKDGNIDYDLLTQSMAARGLGSHIGAARAEGYNANKARNEAFIQEGKVFQAQLNEIDPDDPNGPAIMAQLIQGHHDQNSITGRMLRQQGGDPAKSLSALNQAVSTNQFPQFLARSQMGAEEWYKRNTLTAEQQSMATDRAAGRTNAAGQLRVAERNAATNEGRLAFDMNRPPSAAKGKNAPSPEGRSQVSNLTSAMRRYYDELNAAGGAVVPEGDVVSNIKARLSGTAAGQAVGSYIGTKAQSARTKIKQIRPLLVNAIKQATGMSAQQMNSNVELQLFLNAASNPDTADINANLEALNNIEKLYGLGEATAATPAAAAPAGKTVTRTGSINGRKVIEYSDGSVVYAP